jgi:hypothetical protein
LQFIGIILAFIVIATLILADEPLIQILGWILLIMAARNWRDILLAGRKFVILLAVLVATAFAMMAVTGESFLYDVLFGGGWDVIRERYF